MTAAPGVDLSAQADAQIERIAAVLRSDGREEAAANLLARYHAPPRAKPALFVAGEDKRGKSCLVNALLGRADLSPVGVEVVTAAPITFFQSAEPVARVLHYGQPEPDTVEFEAARALATVEGNPRNEHNVRGVALGVDAPLLADLNLIDTPGVGGLDSGHATLTLQSLQAADALLFVSEAAAQFRAQELDFLRRAAARVDTVILVLTKTDLHRGWRAILEDDRTILKEQAPRFASAPILPVSSVLALRALSAPDEQDGALMREESGIAALEQAIRQRVAGQAATLKVANALRTGMGAMAAVEMGLRETLAAAGSDEAPRQALEAERVRLQQLQKDRTLGPQILDAEIRKLMLDRSEAASSGTIEIRRRYEQRLRNVKKKEQDELPGELVADLEALAAKLNEDAATRLGELVEQLVSELDDKAPLSEAIRAATDDALKEELEASSVGDFGMTANDKFMVLSSFSSGRNLASLSTIVAGALIAPPIGIALGLGLGGLFAFESFIAHGQQRFQTAFTQWMTAQISQAQLTINTSFQRDMIDVQAQIREAVQQALADREKEIATALRNAEEMLKSETAKRTQASAALTARLKTVVAARGQTATLLTALASTRAAAPALAAQPARGQAPVQAAAVPAQQPAARAASEQAAAGQPAAASTPAQAAPAQSASEPATAPAQTAGEAPLAAPAQPALQPAAPAPAPPPPSAAPAPPIMLAADSPAPPDPARTPAEPAP